MSNILILIPSRLHAVRLPNKPLLEINKLPLIFHVYNLALKIQDKNIFVVTGDKKIFNKIKYFGGNSILTKKNHKNGTERIFEGFKNLKKNKIDYILNLQGDEPILNISEVKKFLKNVIKGKFEMGTMACKINKERDLKNKNLVKVETFEKIGRKNSSYAKNFFRDTNNQTKNIYHHIGIYIYKVRALKKYIKKRQSKIEKKLKLEQLRALENGIRIRVFYSNHKPIGVDTLEDFKKVKKLMEKKK